MGLNAFILREMPRNWLRIPPFVLDFGGAYLDRPPDYTPEIWADWRAMKSAAFESNWPAVQKILTEFESYGIFIADVNPANIQF